MIQSFISIILTVPMFAAPVAKKIPKAMSLHGHTRTDPFYWMRNKDSAEVKKYIAAENQYSAQFLKNSAALKDTLMTEMKSRIQEVDQSVPYRESDYLYYERYEKGREYPIYCRRKDEGPESVILDVNLLAQGRPYISAVPVDISPSGRYLAYAIDVRGDRQYSVYFKDLDTGKNLSQVIRGSTGEWLWLSDDEGLFVAQEKETLRSYQVKRRSLKKKTATVFLTENDARFDMSIRRSLNNRFIFIEADSYDAGETYVVDVENPVPVLFAARESRHEYEVESAGEGFFIRTNWQAPNFQLMFAPGPSKKEEWKEFSPHRKKSLLEEFIVFEKYLVLQYREEGLPKFEVTERLTQKMHKVPFTQPFYEAEFDINTEYSGDTLRFVYSHLAQPERVQAWNMKTQELSLLKEEVVPGFDTNKYTVERIWAPSHDNLRIPVSVVYHKEHFKPHSNPLLVYGYGSYGLSEDVHFDSEIISLLDRGFVFAIAHVRGGQELGRDWYEQGRLQNKMNTFRDFISATEFLLEKGLGARGKVFAEGGSAGGLLMGVVLNLRPDLYFAVHAAVPFVDVLTTMLDPTIPLTTEEYDQWGNPNIKSDYETMLSYSPYDNVRSQNYPHVLITSGYHDSQVQYWEPLKWTAKLREANSANTQVLLKMEMSAGHSGISGRYLQLADSAEVYAYFLSLLPSP